MQNFIAAQKLIDPIASRYEFADKVDPAVLSQVEKIAKSNGFASLEELGDVAFTISIVLAGLDRQTGQFTDVPERIKKAMEELEQGKQWPWSQEYKDQTLAQMQEDLKTAAPLQFKENVALVRKYQKQLDQRFDALVREYEKQLDQLLEQAPAKKGGPTKR